MASKNIIFRLARNMLCFCAGILTMPDKSALKNTKTEIKESNLMILAVKWQKNRFQQSKNNTEKEWNCNICVPRVFKAVSRLPLLAQSFQS
jgi:hypothetical protein